MKKIEENRKKSVVYNGLFSLLDSSGKAVVKYIYDAWGACEVRNPDGTVNDSASFIGNLNPFRYRGYYFDVETGLYFLKTRYYDPQVGRFITIDDLQYLEPETINGLNLYAYCGNNPVMCVDTEGTKKKWWKKFWKKIACTLAVVADFFFVHLFFVFCVQIKV